MRLTYRLSTSLILGVVAVSLAFSFVQTRADTQGLRRDLERNAVVLAESLARSAEPLVEARSYRDLQRLVDRFRDRDQIAGVAVYDANGLTLAITTGLQARLRGDTLPPANGHSGPGSGPNSGPNNEWFGTQFVKLGGRPMHIALLPLRDDGTVIGGLAVYHDAAYIDMQAAALWRRAFTGVMIQTVLIALVTLVTIRFGLGRPLARMARWLHDLRVGEASKAPELPEAGVFEPLTREVAQLASSLTAARAAAEQEARLRDLHESKWTAERLRVFVRNRLDGRRLFVVSNREPYEHFYRGGAIESSVPASGLVTAVEPILRACDGTWIAQATGDADRATVDEFDRAHVPPDHPQYMLRRVWLTPEEEQGFYSGFSNEGIWPLCHVAHTRPVFRLDDWEHYRAVNQKFANALLEEIAGEEHPAVLVQDYHFALLPRMIKQARPDARVAIFWHIPWPNPEAFGICPWQRELLDGLLGADLIGFHVQAHCNNFLDTVDRVLEARITWEHFAVMRGGHETQVRPFPISVAFDEDAFEQTGAPEPELERLKLFESLGVRASLLGVGVDRVDYTKGIPERFAAIERFLEKYPAYRREFTFVQIGSPSRTHITRYNDLGREVAEQADRINRRFQTGEWRPIVFLNTKHSHRQIQPYYRLAHLCMVTSLHDGMNLVAKEFVSARKDAQGALILSCFTGASHELSDALVVNPYDTEELAGAIWRALEMDPAERMARMQRMRATVEANNIYRWAANLIGELCDIRVSAQAAPPACSIVAEAASAEVL
ncbi:MAG TPA: trehalose-6-phosphate synthase [Bryobacteraceae bacterium]|nr:trehalose-6-phosphate synthase [Bryobacteraceae bacterium]